MSAIRSPWALVLASLMFLAGSLSFLDTDHYTLGAWLFVFGSAVFLSHSIAEALARRDPG